MFTSTYVGADRNMRQNMHGIIDTKNILRNQYILLTMACKQKWPDIKRSILSSQNLEGRQYLIVREFRRKIKSVTSYVI